MQTKSLAPILFESKNHTHQLSSEQKIDYSRMKFWCRRTSRKIGEEMAKFLKEVIDISSPLVITSAPSSTLPKASNTLCDFIRQSISETQQKQEIVPSILSTYIKNDALYPTDYGKLSLQERAKLIENDRVSFDTHQAFDGWKTLIIVDDLRMTGTLEKKVETSVLAYGDIVPKNIQVLFFYYMMNINSESLPELEDELNFYAIKSEKDFIDIAKSGMIINLRVIKYFLNLEKKSIETILHSLDIDFLINIRGALIDSRCAEIDRFREKVWFSIAIIDTLL